MSSMMKTIGSLMLMAALTSSVAAADDFSSSKLASKAWAAFGAGKYDEAIKVVDQCEKLYGPQAKKMQEALTAYPKDKDETLKPWAFNDVGTCLYIKGQALLKKGDKEALGPILSRDFDLRRSVYTISPENLLLIEVAREMGAHAKQTGSGGAAIGTYRDEDQYRKLAEAYGSKGFAVFKVNVTDY